MGRQGRLTLRVSMHNHNGMPFAPFLTIGKESLMQVEVRFYGFVRDVVDTSPLALQMPDCCTLRNLVDLLVQRYGEKLHERLYTNAGELEANVRVFVEDAQAGSLEELLGDGQKSSAEVKVFVLSATAGG